MTSNETSFSLLKSVIAEGVYTYVHLRKYIKSVVNLQKTVDSYGCAAAIGSSNQMTEDMSRDRFKGLFQLMISQLYE